MDLLLLSLTLTYLCLVLNYLLINRNNAVLDHVWYGTAGGWARWARHIFSHFTELTAEMFHTFKSLPSCKIHRSTLCMPQSSNSNPKNPCEEVEAAWERFQQTCQILLCGWQCCIKACMVLQSSKTPTQGQVKPLALRQWQFRRPCVGWSVSSALEYLEAVLSSKGATHRYVPPEVLILRDWITMAKILLLRLQSFSATVRLGSKVRE